jgi:hypothetical protein
MHSNSALRWLRRPRPDAWVFLGLALFSFAFFFRTLGFDFVDFDDRTILLAHPNLYDAGSFTASLSEIFVHYFPREEPLLVRDVSWALDAHFFGFENPYGYHLTNVVLHALVVGLVFLFLARAMRNRIVAGGVALAFAVTPIHVEPVSWVMGRKDLLAAFFMTLGILAQSIELTNERVWARRLAWALCFVCCALALGSKISAVAFVVVLAVHRILTPYLEGGCAPNARIDLRAAFARLPALVPHGVVTVAVFAWYRGVLADYGVIRAQGPGPLDPEHLGHVIQFQPLIAGEYLMHLIWPSELSVYYRWPHVEIPLGLGETLASIGLAIGLTGAVALLLWRRRDVAFYALFPIALLAPYSGLFYVGLWHADRYFYLACTGVFAVVGIAIQDLAQRMPKVKPALALLVAGFLVSSSAIAWQQQDVWRDDESLWSYEANRSEPSLLSIQALAKIYLHRAEAAKDPAEKQRWIQHALHQLERGHARDREMAREPGPYRVPENKHLARLHVMSGRAAALSGATPPVQMAHYRRAFELAPDRLTAILLSRNLFEIASGVPEDARQRWVEASFEYFVQYLSFSAADPQHLQEGRELLENNYGDRFPYLTARVEETRRRWFQ